MMFRIGQYLLFKNKKKIARVTDIGKNYISLRYYTYNKAKDGYSGGMKPSRLISLFNKKQFIFIPPKIIVEIVMNQFFEKDTSKIKLYCKNPNCFNHFLANHKIKGVEK